MQAKIAEYVSTWKHKGYSHDIPDEVPQRLAQLQLAPSYRAICIAILKNDHALQSLGFVPPQSAWYRELKRIEIEGRASAQCVQLDFWR